MIMEHPNQNPTNWFKINYFESREIRCKCGCGCDFICEDIMLIVDKVRKELGMPCAVSSGIRCPTHNEKIGGASQSFHIAMPKRGLFGQAVDFKPGDRDVRRAYDVSDKILGESGGLILYRSWVHIDCRHEKYRKVK